MGALTHVDVLQLVGESDDLQVTLRLIFGCQGAPRRKTVSVAVDERTVRASPFINWRRKIRGSSSLDNIS